MIVESLDTTQKICSEPNVELTQVSDAAIAGKSLGRKYKTGRKVDKTVRFAEEFDEENTIHQIGTGSLREDRFLEKGSQEGLDIVEEPEIIYVTEREDDEKIQHEEEPEEIIIEELNKREAETNDMDEAAAEVEIPPIETVATGEVLLPDAITPSLKLLIFNIVLPTIDIFLDTALVQKLFLNGYWGSGAFVTAGILTNFLFTSIAWWRMESAKQKKWSWIFLMLQLWPQLRALQVLACLKNIAHLTSFQVTLLLVKGDPKGYEEQEALDREVHSLESFLEALPSLSVLSYLARVYPHFLYSLGLASYYRPFIQTCFTMTLFLKSGPCFILPSRGLFGGLFTWRFMAIVALNQFGFKIKFVEPEFYGETFIMNAVCLSTFGAFLGLFSIHRAVGSWRTVFSLVLKFPPLLFLPIFGFVTFGVAPKGESEFLKISTNQM